MRERGEREARAEKARRRARREEKARRKVEGRRKGPMPPRKRKESEGNERK